MICVFLLFSFSLTASTIFTLQEAIGRSQTHALAIFQSEEQVSLQQQLYHKSLMDWLPSLRLNATYQPQGVTQASLGVYQPLSTLLSQSNQTQMAFRKVKISKLQEQMVKRELAFQTFQLYRNCQKLVQKQVIAETSAKRAQAQQKSIEKQSVLGKMGPSDVLRAQLAASQAFLEVESVKTQYELCMNQMDFLLGFEGDYRPTLDVLQNNLDASHIPLQMQPHYFHLDMALKETDIQMAQSEASAQKLAFVPDTTFFVEHSIFLPVPSLAWGVTLSWSPPLDPFGLLAANHAIKEKQWGKKLLQQELSKETQALQLRLKHALLHWNLSKQILEQAQKAYQMEMRKLELKKSTLLEVLTLEKELKEAQYNALEALMAMEEGHILLQKNQGSILPKGFL